MLPIAHTTPTGRRELKHGMSATYATVGEERREAPELADERPTVVCCCPCGDSAAVGHTAASSMGLVKGAKEGDKKRHRKRTVGVLEHGLLRFVFRQHFR